MRADGFGRLEGRVARLLRQKVERPSTVSDIKRFEVKQASSTGIDERSPQVGRLRPADALAVSHRGRMPMSPAYAIALAEARSCLAALADGATDFDESIHFEHLLLDLDGLHPIGPGLSPMAGTKSELVARLEGAVDAMIGLGGDGLSLEQILAEALSDSDRTGCG